MKTNFEEQSDALVTDAATWRLASLLLERPRGNWMRDVEALANEIPDAALVASARAVTDASDERYQSLFGPGGAVSPREVSYCGFEDPGQLMAALQAFYHAFSFQPEREEAIDHIAVEAGFVGFLYLKEAYARMQKNLSAADITREARERFVQQHLKRCALGATERLRQAPVYIRSALTWLAEKTKQAAADSPQSQGKPDAAV